ncbi:MAG: nicotinate-nucleotide adenylyltransferase [Bacteroidota bacterium]
MNIGVLGGTFNPPHLGHLIVAERVREELGLAKILFIPSAVSPHKQHLDLVDPSCRMEMVQLALLGQQFFEASDLEVSRGGVSYTVDTLEHLKSMYQGVRLHLLIGMDNLGEFNTWRLPEKIGELAQVVVMTRPGFQDHPVSDGSRMKFMLCQVPEIGISSRDIRERVKQGKSIRYLVPKPVESYIHYRKLYR